MNVKYFSWNMSKNDVLFNHLGKHLLTPKGYNISYLAYAY